MVLEMAVLKRIINKKIAYFGSYGWSGGALAHLKKIIEPVKWDLVGSFDFAGGVTKENLKRGETFGIKFGELIFNTGSK